MLIDVTQECIDKGITADCRSCPVALAIHKSINDDNIIVEVDRGVIKIVEPKSKYYVEGRTLSIKLPLPAVLFIRHFDRGFIGYCSHVHPFTFTLDYTPYHMLDYIPYINEG